MKAWTKNTFTSSCRHAQIQKLLSGEGGGGPGPMARKQPGQRFFYLSSKLILQFTEGVQWVIYRENFTFPRIQRGSNIFQGGWGGGGVGV